MKSRASSIGWQLGCCLCLLACHCAGSVAVALQDAGAAGNSAAAACGRADPDKVDKIPDATGNPNANTCLVQWLSPDEGSGRAFFYQLILKCSGCGDAVVNLTSGEDIMDHTFANLKAATIYNVSITAGLKNCTTSDPFHFECKTPLTGLQNGSLKITDLTETSLRASWDPSPDEDVQYRVECSGVAEQVRDLPNATFFGLQSGTDVKVRVRPVKTGFPSSVPIYAFPKTKLFAIDADSAQVSKTATAITVSWNASKTASVTYELACSGPGGDKIVQTSGLTATCDSLQSGQAYRLSVTVNKTGGFDSVETDLGLHLTKPNLSTDPAHYAADVSVTGSDAGTAVVSLKINWTPTPSNGADSMLIKVTSELNEGLNVSASAPFWSNRSEVTIGQFFSDLLRVSLTAVAEKSGLTEQSSESFIMESVPTPPNSPLILPEPEKRLIKVTLTASSRSESIRVSVRINGSDATSGPDELDCSPEGLVGNCSVTFQPLKPFTHYDVEAVSEFRNRSSLRHRVTSLTLEDAPTQPRSLTVNAQSSPGPGSVRLEWQEPMELNGKITEYLVLSGILDPISGAEILHQNVSTGATHINLTQTMAAGQEHFWSVIGCTGGGCGNRSNMATRLIDDAVASAVSILGASVSNETVALTWQSASHSQGVVFEYVILLIQEPLGECASAKIANCTNCGRSRDGEWLSEEVRSRLESLTRGCSGGVNVENLYRIEDSQVSVSLAVRTAAASMSSSAQPLLPWTSYTAAVLPVNRAGNGSVTAVQFRTQEAPSGRVRDLSVTEEALDAVTVQFTEPVVKNGLVMAYAVQVFSISSTDQCLELAVVNVTGTTCQIDKCTTDEILTRLSADCAADLSVRPGVPTDASADIVGGVLKATLGPLKRPLTYVVRVTPVSQTLLGATAERLFRLDGPPQPDSSNSRLVVVVVSVVVSVLVVAALVAGAIAFVIIRRRRGDSPSAARKSVEFEDRPPAAENFDGFSMYVRTEGPNRFT